MMSDKIYSVHVPHPLFIVSTYSTETSCHLTISVNAEQFVVFPSCLSNSEHNVLLLFCMSVSYLFCFCLYSILVLYVDLRS